jgi:hypothetical protein
MGNSAAPITQALVSGNFQMVGNKGVFIGAGIPVTITYLPDVAVGQAFPIVTIIANGGAGSYSPTANGSGGWNLVASLVGFNEKFSITWI